MANALIARAFLTDAIVPVQVMGEFLNVCRRKSILSHADAIARVEEWCPLFRQPVTGIPDLIAAAILAERFRLQFFDALIATVVRNAGAMTLLTEDMQEGADLNGLRIVNPFAPANATLIESLLA